MAPILPSTQLPQFDVFAVESDAAQLTWRRLPKGRLSAVVNNAELDLGEAQHPGAAEVTGLRPDASHTLDLFIDGRYTAQAVVDTLPAGAPQSTKIATISDLHFGEKGFGLVKKLRDDGPDPYPLRCAQSAARDAVAWGAELLVIKGDITCHGKPEEWEMFDEFLADVPINVIAIPGNHDVTRALGALDSTTELHRRGLFPAPVSHVDVGGTRIVAVDSTVAGRSYGNVGRRQAEISDAVDVDQPALVFTHHHLEDRPLPWFWPLGVRYLDGTRLVNALLEANPDLLISSGHTHRNRMRRHRSAVITEVSSTKDYPGVWAGYVLSADGIRQVVRRVSDPGSMQWTDRTHAAVGGIWGRWSPGPLQHRSFVHGWTRSYQRSAAAATPQPWASPNR